MRTNRLSLGICCSCTTVAMMLILMAAAAATSAQAQTYTVLHAFTSVPDAANPHAPMIRDAQGNFYGTSISGGLICFNPASCGTVFKIDASGKESVFYAFKGGGDGDYPVAPLIQDSEGNFYGDTLGNGALGAVSTIFKLDPSGHETVLWAGFDSHQVCCQDSPLALDASGNIYGSSPYAGNMSCGYENVGCGTIYKLTQAGKLSVLHVFGGTDGIQPEGGVVLGANGDIFGSTPLGGNLNCFAPYGTYGITQGCGTIYKLDKHTHKLTTLYVFEGKKDGSAPLILIQDAVGNLYGIAEFGGDLSCWAPAGCGTIFELDTKGHFRMIYAFTPSDTFAAGLVSQLIRDAKGNLYGVSTYGGAHSVGFLFKVTPAGKFTNLFSFPSTAEPQEGFTPEGVTMDSSGNFYGTMLLGGQQTGSCAGFGCGTVFKITF